MKKQYNISEGDDSISLTFDTEKIELIIKNNRIDENNNTKNNTENHGPGSQTVGIKGIITTMIYLIILTIVLLVSLVKLWPYNGISSETNTLVIVMLAGALGSQVHSLMSFYWYVGNRSLVYSWLAMYLLLPFVGLILGFIFYIVIRGGFFSPMASIEETRPFGFVALSALVGLFSVEALLKLRNIAESVFVKAPPGKNSKPQEGENIDIQKID